jgi:hypothetical protein
MVRRPHPASFLAERLPLRPGIGLALGGGFARGYAHLGVLRVLEEHQIPIACLTGSSSGCVRQWGAAATHHFQMPRHSLSGFCQVAGLPLRSGQQRAARCAGAALLRQQTV